jgi:hypothetical protein
VDSATSEATLHVLNTGDDVTKWANRCPHRIESKSTVSSAAESLVIPGNICQCGFLQGHILGSSALQMISFPNSYPRPETNPPICCGEEGLKEDKRGKRKKMKETNTDGNKETTKHVGKERKKARRYIKKRQ